MRDGIRTILKMACSATIVAAGLTVTVPAAHADWNGRCYIDRYRSSAHGWCDGTGPQRYQIGVKCSNGRWYWSANAPWFGDRRGATAYCPGGELATGKGWRRH